MVARKELRARARQQLGGGIFKTNWLVFVLVEFVVGAVAAAAAAIGGIGTYIVMGPIAYGVARMSVKLIANSEKVDYQSVITGFSDDFLQAFLLGLLTGLFEFLWSLLFVIPGIVKHYAYSMAPFIQQDSEDKNWKKCLDESRKMMKGHKMQLFLLELSFLGWIILGALCFGIGTLFVIPYMDMAKANFYDELKKNPVVE